MLPFKSIFSSAKVIDYDLFPKLPNVREIEEDLENSSKNDPVFVFAQLLQDIANSSDSNPPAATATSSVKLPMSPISGSPRSTDTTTPLVSESSERESQSQTSTSQQARGRDFEVLPKSLVINSLKDAKSKIHSHNNAHHAQRGILKSPITTTASSIGLGVGMGTPDSSKRINQEVYTNFRKMASLCEKTKDGIELFEVKLKELDIECKKFLEDCEQSVLVRPRPNDNNAVKTKAEKTKITSEGDISGAGVGADGDGWEVDDQDDNLQ